MLLNWCWRRLLRIPWTARKSNQSILKQISPECSFEGLMLKLKLQYFGYLMQRVDSLEKTWCWERLKAEGEGDDSGWDGWMASLTRSTWVWVSPGCWWWTGKPGLLQSMESLRVGHDWTELLSAWSYKNFLSHKAVFSNFNTHTHTPPEDFKCRFWFSRFGVWTEILYFPGWWWLTGSLMQYYFLWGKFVKWLKSTCSMSMKKK